MILAIDCGNTRIKWGIAPLDRELPPGEGVHWTSTGAVPLAEIGRLDSAWDLSVRPEAIAVANLAGERAREALQRSLARFSVAPLWLRAAARQCGVANGYADPAQLGADRWAALIAAHALHGGDCLVVGAGTATTIDLLGADGRFRGGAILPGLELMKRSLAAGTAALPLASGRFQPEPRCTEDAIETGCLHGQAGAIARMFALLGDDALCLLTGGAAPLLAALLDMPVRVHEHLVLDGLARIGREGL